MAKTKTRLTPAIRAEIKGIKQTTEKMEQMIRDLHGAPILEAFRQATLLVTRHARINSPVDTGRLRASITPEVRQEGRKTFGIVGSVVRYAPYQEFGTRFMPGKLYLTRAVEDNRSQIQDIIGGGVIKIVEK